jgi:hypothetical protein
MKKFNKKKSYFCLIRKKIFSKLFLIQKERFENPTKTSYLQYQLIEGHFFFLLSTGNSKSMMSSVE